MSLKAKRLTKPKKEKKTIEQVLEKKASKEYAPEKTRGFVLSPSQKKCQNIIRENTLTFIQGYAGTGKSLAALDYAVQEYKRDITKRIVVVRTPAESAGKDKIGYLPADLASKTEPHFASAKKILIDLLGKGKVEADMEKRIFFMIPNYMLGSTFDNSIIVVDEAQMMEPLVMKLVLERIGQDSQCIVLGDNTQVYSHDKGRNGLSDALERFFPGSSTLVTPEVQNVCKSPYDGVGRYTFSVESVMRSEIVKTVIRAYSGSVSGNPNHKSYTNQGNLKVYTQEELESLGSYKQPIID